MLRVIAGKYRGRRLQKVPGSGTRPTADRIKESAFQIMGPFFAGGLCLDLFAGSGSLGIEAVSRGCDRVVFIDRSKKAIQTLAKNIQSLQMEEQSTILRMDAQKYLKTKSNRHKPFDLILIDPPYKQVNYNEIIKEIKTLNLLANQGLIYCEHDPKEEIILPKEGLNIFRQMNYSQTTTVTIFQQTTEMKKE